MALETSTQAADMVRNRAWSRFAIPLRLILGIGCMIHGFPRIFDASNRPGFIDSLRTMQIPMPEVMAWLVGILESVGGVLLIIGAFTAARAVTRSEREAIVR